MGTQLPWGHKQLHIEHEGEREDWGKKSSLKKNKICKATKGEHIQDHFELSHGGFSGWWRCKCGKKVDYKNLCRTCKKEVDWKDIWDMYRLDGRCPSCRELDKKTEV